MNMDTNTRNMTKLALFTIMCKTLILCCILGTLNLIGNYSEGLTFYATIALVLIGLINVVNFVFSIIVKVTKDETV